jgi:hypothetical protein
MYAVPANEVFFWGGNMSGVAGRSGGHNKLPAEAHLLRGTFRPDRHAGAPSTEADRVSDAERRRALRGLSTTGRRQVTALLAEFEGWDSSSLSTLRAYALSCERLEQLQAAVRRRKEVKSMLYKEIRANLQLLKALALESAR